jgi:hypothetical protein
VDAGFEPSLGGDQRRGSLDEAWAAERSNEGPKQLLVPNWGVVLPETSSQ